MVRKKINERILRFYNFILTCQLFFARIRVNYLQKSEFYKVLVNFAFRH
jgi:hypothetical protein